MEKEKAKENVYTETDRINDKENKKMFRNQK